MEPFVLVVEDETILGDSICQYLAHHGYATAVARSGEEGVRLAEEGNPDVAVVDLRLPGIDGLEVLRRVREISPSTVVILMTAHSSVTSAVDAMRQGAFDYLTKPLALEELRIVVDKALTHLRQSRELAYLKARSAAGGHLSEMLGESPPMVALRAQVRQAAALESPADGRAPAVLIRGETGTGKELVARALHFESPRAAGPFVEINCAAIPATLLEAELFGYEKGAYTDAKTGKAGLFEAADGGTLLLDEIGHMDLALQAKLLRVTEDMTVRRVGGLRPKTVNVRIVAATNRDLEAAIAEGVFRADLYYRLNVLTIELPPLRDRGEDVIVLARYFAARTVQRYGLPARMLTPDAEAAIVQYPWPGNVRELAHVVERGVLLHKDGPVDAEALRLSVSRAEIPVAVEPGGRVRVDFSAGVIALDEVERELIRQALDASRWNRTEAAQRLGMSRDTLRYRIEKHGLEPPVANA